jgi:hypothetical protein
MTSSIARGGTIVVSKPSMAMLTSGRLRGSAVVASAGSERVDWAVTERSGPLRDCFEDDLAHSVAMVEACECSTGFFESEG